MILEKHKVYKVFHCPLYLNDVRFNRDYLLICPTKDILIKDGFFKKPINKFMPEAKKFECFFVVCFDGSCAFNCTSCIFEDCSIEPLNENDLKDIKRALDGLGHRFKYNRKIK